MSRPYRCFVALALAVAASAGLLAAAPGAGAQDAFDQEISQAQADVQAAQAAAHEIHNKLVATQQQQAAVEQQVAAVQAHIAQIEAQIPVLRAKARQLKKEIRERAAVLYRHSGPYTPDETFSLNPTMRTVRAKHLGDAAAKSDEDTRQQLKAIAKALEAKKQELAQQQAELAKQQAQLAKIQNELTFEQAELNKRVQIANEALARAKAIGALRARGEPVQGPTILTAAQMAGWWRTRGYHFRVSGINIDELAQIFVEEGQAEGVRGDFAFAQSIVETGGFSASPSYNFAGLGWCDSCSSGSRFPSARDGVRAQIQHLLNYADSSSRSWKLHHPPSPYWYGSDPGRAARNFDTFYAKGWAPTWNDMGHGNWATDPHYSGKVLNVYRDMVAYAQAHG